MQLDALYKRLTPLTKGFCGSHYNIACLSLPSYNTIPVLRVVTTVVLPSFLLLIIHYCFILIFISKFIPVLTHISWFYRISKLHFALVSYHFIKNKSFLFVNCSFYFLAYWSFNSTRAVLSFSLRTGHLSPSSNISKSWKWLQYVPPKRRQPPDSLNGVKTQKNIIILTIVRTSNFTQWTSVRGQG
jgi:hypothetical protein